MTEAPRLSYGFDHLHLRSRDADAAARVYVTCFGAREEGRMDGRITLTLAGVTLFVEQAPEGTNPGSTAPNLGLEHMALRVENLEQALLDLGRLGVPILSPARALRPDLQVAFVQGPDGVLIELLQRD